MYIEWHMPDVTMQSLCSLYSNRNFDPYLHTLCYTLLLLIVESGLESATQGIWKEIVRLLQSQTCKAALLFFEYLSVSSGK